MKSLLVTCSMETDQCVGFPSLDPYSDNLVGRVDPRHEDLEVIV